MTTKTLSPIILLTTLLSSLLLTGCQSTSTDLTDVVIAEPLAVNYNKEVQLSRLNQILASNQITDEQRAQFHYDRGWLYDSIGLNSLASFDFNYALKLKPDLAEAYNYIGVYLTLSGNFDKAYEAFDSANDLNPAYQFAFLSRGIALYYGNRAKLASQDLQRYVAFSPTDPYRVIWQYIVDTKQDPQQAKLQLAQNAKVLTQASWPQGVIDLYLGYINEKTFLQSLQKNVTTQQQRAERLCEAYFYLAKYHSFNNNEKAAEKFYKLALSTNVYEFIEHKYARLELKLQKKV